MEPPPRATAAGGFSVTRGDGYWIAKFQAMGSPCEVLIDTDEEGEARGLAGITFAEADRIEQKWSRYRPGNIIATINQSGGASVPVDDETARLLNFGAECHRLSGGRFDITSGVLRRVWTFDGGDHHPSAAEIDAVRHLVGWQRVTWDGKNLRLAPGMEIDLGGLGKEYAVDRAVALLQQASRTSMLVNFGGDIAVTGPRRHRRPWIVGIEKPRDDGRAARVLDLHQGALATSGDSRRYVMINGKRHSHILDPRTGWPVTGAPRSVTVAAPTCTQAGFVSTLAMLHGREAEKILQESGYKYWCY